MNIVAITISALALLLSMFTFYWLHIRDRKNFYLLRIDRFLHPLRPEFALVNGGNKDILITTLECGFDDASGNGVTYLAQTIAFNENDSFLLQAGKSFHCKVKFTEPFTSSFAKEGELIEGSRPPIYMRDMRIDIAWIETTGNTESKTVKISKYGFSEEGNIMRHLPMEKKHDLYK